MIPENLYKKTFTIHVVVNHLKNFSGYCCYRICKYMTNSKLNKTQPSWRLYGVESKTMNASFMDTTRALLIPATLPKHSYSCVTMRRATVCCQKNLWRSSGFYHTISHNTDNTQCRTQKNKTLLTNWSKRNPGWTLVSAYASFQSFPTAILYQINAR